MDPNECRKNTVRLARIVARECELDQESSELAADLAQAVLDLDNWLCSGGFAPDAWKANDSKPQCSAADNPSMMRPRGR